VTTAASGVISGTTDGVEVGHATGTVLNLGTIVAEGTNSVGLWLLAGGSISNRESGSTGGLVEGNFSGVEIQGATGTVVNFGSIESSSGWGAYFAAGGMISNYGVISTTSTAHAGVSFHNTAGAVTNNGTIESTGNEGVYFQTGGNVMNQSEGLISGGQNGVEVLGGAGTVVNGGTIASAATGTSGEAIYLGDGGVITNYGMIAGAHPPTPSGTTTLFGGVIITHAEQAIINNFGTIAPTNEQRRQS
jgi:hypothetical protein